MEDAHRPLAHLPPWRILGWLIVAVFALVCTAFLVPLRQSLFVAWDDNYLVYFNPNIKQISFHTLKAIFTSYDPELYIPVTFFSYQIDYLLAGLSPFQFHLTNVLLHTSNALLIGWLTLLLSRRGWAAVAACLLFAVHPLHTEAVAWASARKDLLSTFFFLLSLIAYLFHRDAGGRRMYLLSLGAFVLGLLAKVMVLTLPVVLLLIDWRDRRPISTKMLLEKLPYFAFSFVFGVIALFGKRDSYGSWTGFSNLLMGAKSTVFYLEKLFVPIHLSVLYPFTGTIDIHSSTFLVPVVISSLLICTVCVTLKWTREVAFGYAFFQLTLLPTFANFSKGQDLYFASDRYAYLPSIGILFLVCLGGVYSCILAERQNMREVRARVAACIGAVILGVFLVLSYQQALTWQDSVALFTNTLQYYPQAIAARLNLAMVYRQMGQIDDARTELLLADAIRPHSRTHVALATLYEREGKRAQAFTEYQKAVSIDARDPEPHFGLGILYQKDGKTDLALAEYRKVLAIDPQYVGTYNNLAAIAMEQGDLVTARKQYEKAVEIDPYFPDAYFNLGLIAEQQGRIDDAIGLYEHSASLQPGQSADALTHLLDLYAKRNDVAHAASTAKRLLTIDPSQQTAAKFLEALRQKGLID